VKQESYLGQLGVPINRTDSVLLQVTQGRMIVLISLKNYRHRSSFYWKDDDPHGRQRLGVAHGPQPEMR
jgi:hypothetical protein